MRVVVAKVGLDGHDRGLRIVARILRDAGIEVIYLGLRQTPQAIAQSARDEDADAIGLSMHNGAHLTLAGDVLEALSTLGLRTPLIIGGIVPEDDRTSLLKMGVSQVLGPGASDDDVVRAVELACAN